MLNKGKQILTDDIGSLELDPNLWKGLAQELLQRVLTKLPFSALVAFRTVSKTWYSEIIPRSAPYVQASSALLYFGSHIEESKGSAWWLQVCNTKSKWTGALEEFQSESFPSPRSGEDVQLMICEEGLFFFGFISRETTMVRDIVACNPLTAQSKVLGLPRPLRSPLESPDPDEWCGLDVVFGVIFDTKSGKYDLVTAGVDETGRHATFLYDSSTNTWKNGSSILPILLEAGGDAKDLCFEHRRSLCCNGNLYWNALSTEMQYVFMFSILTDTWRIIPVMAGVQCPGPDSNDLLQLAAYDGRVCLWHLHMVHRDDEDSTDDDTDENPTDGDNADTFDSNYVRYPQRVNWQCRSDLGCGLDPELRMMHHYDIERIDEFFSIQAYHGIEAQEYVAFSQGNFIYHVMLLSSEHLGMELFLKIVVHNTDVNSYTEMPIIHRERFPGPVNHYFSPSNVWSFSASLTSVP